MGIGVEYAYDLDYGKPEELWHVSPYARLNFTHYRQKAFREHGAGVFDRSFGSYSDNKYMFIMNVCQRVWDDLEDEDVDKVKQAYKEYIEAGNPPIPGEDGDEIDYE